MEDYPRPLTEEFVRSRDLAPGRYFDRDGLYLRVRKSGRKYWEHRFKVGGKLRTKGLGPYPVVGLEDASHGVRLNLVQVHEGKNQFSERRTAPVPARGARRGARGSVLRGRSRSSRQAARPVSMESDPSLR